MKNQDVDVSEGVGTIELASWSEFSDWMNSGFLKYRNYIFRGQNEDKLLLPTLDRINANTTERAAHLQRFKMAARGRRGSTPENLSDENLWWALGQHYGLLTPLLDWTESPFVAAFFAFSASRFTSERQGQVVVFALSKRSLQQHNPSLPPIELVEPLLNENARLTSQAGLFTKTAAGQDIESWVRKEFSSETSKAMLIKIYIPQSEHDKAFRALKWMNIHKASLFPDLGGAALLVNDQLTIEGY